MMTSSAGLFFVFLIVETQGTINLALNKQAFQTDTFDNKYASLAVDGNPSYNYSDGTCTRTVTNDASWEVDLCDVYNVSLVEIYNRIDCCANDLQDLEIYTGPTREQYEFVGSQPGPAPSVVNFTLHTTPTFRWLKVSRKSGSQTPLTLCEVKVFLSDDYDGDDDDDDGQDGDDYDDDDQEEEVIEENNNSGQILCNSNSHYNVDATKQGTSDVIETRVAMSKIICIVQCRMTVGCQSAIFNLDNRQCHMLQTSDYVANTDDNTVLLTPTS